MIFVFVFCVDDGVEFLCVRATTVQLSCCVIVRFYIHALTLALIFFKGLTTLIMRMAFVFLCDQPFPFYGSC